MMNTLFESKPRKKRSAGGTIFSVGLHMAIVFFAVYATARAGVPEEEKAPEQKVNFVKMKKEEPPPPVEKKKEEPPPPKVKKAEPKTPKLAELPPAPKALRATTRAVRSILTRQVLAPQPFLGCNLNKMG